MIDESHIQSSAEWRDAERDFLTSGRADEAQRAITQLADRAVAEACAAAFAPAMSSAAVFAAGAYGRRELFPFSELDLIIVQEGTLRAEQSDSVAEFIRLLRQWRMRPNHRICSRGSCLAALEQDAELGMKLLDRRLLAGDADIAAMWEQKLNASRAQHGSALCRNIAALTRARHAKRQNTPGHREPDVQETPGGLRDAQALQALARLRQQQAEWPDDLDQATAFLSTVRCFLHYHARGDRNLLDMPAQEAAAAQFGDGRNAAEWMRRYYRSAWQIFSETRRALEACEGAGGTLIDAFRSWQSRLSNQEFSVLRARVYLRRPSELTGDMVCRLLEFVARHGIAPAAQTERDLQGARDALGAFCVATKPLWPRIKSILSQPNAGMAFRALQNAGIVSAVIPEWERIEGLRTEDPEQEYTIDEHTLAAIERICEIRGSTDAAHRRFSTLVSEGEDQALLLIALLYHHMGLSEKGVDSPRDAAAVARAAGARMEMAGGERELAAFLVENQSALSEAAEGRDVDDPATIRALAGRVGTIERLKSLTALAYADISGAGSGATLPFRLEQLWKTYVATERELTRGLETERIRELPASVSVPAEFVAGFPIRYLRAHTGDEMNAHARLYELSRPTGVALQLEQIDGAYRLTVVARDQQALFASMAGAISSFGLDILKAEGFSNSRGIILDSFVFTDPRRTFELNPGEAERLQDMIRRVALGKTEARRLLRSKPRRDERAPSVEPRVRFDDAACETATLVEIEAADRPGLLYSLASVIASNACNVDLVLVDTKGRRAIDVFYIAQDGGQVTPQMQARLKDQLLAVCAGE